ncbi:hypothetical protein [Candidatus Protochlamydia sp. R18]|uniref:hypothetical protein n=1 Tax=Candidatus Protochlamydia sp. R18 TaxID=1353977 RepID=UPI000B042CEB|nr:hypothetical protein [Candidatus Protochlamydia sp. R18]
MTLLTALQYLNLSGCFDLTVAGLVHLTPLTALQHLNLHQFNVRNPQKYSRSLAASISVFEKNRRGLDGFKQ